MEALRVPGRFGINAHAAHARRHLVANKAQMKAVFAAVNNNNIPRRRRRFRSKAAASR